MVKWAKQLVLINNFELEKRVLKILKYFKQNIPDVECRILNLEATGYFGQALADKTEPGIIFITDLPTLIQIFNEDGQVLDMTLYISSNRNNFQVNIIRGSIVEIIGDDENFPNEVLEKYDDVNINLLLP